MSTIAPKGLVPQLASFEDFLAKIDCRLERQNRALHTNLVSWGEILAVLGWHVVLKLPRRAPWLNVRAQAWAAERLLEPSSWSAFVNFIKAHPPATLLLSTTQLLVWMEAEAVSPPLLVALTPREAEVLAWLREGKTGPEVALILGCAQRTIESHVARLYRKLGLHNRVQLHLS